MRDSSNQSPRLARESAKELLSQVDSLLQQQQGASLRKSVVQLLNRVPTYSWVGLYLVRGSELRLDSWAGPAATTFREIPLGKGVTGWSAKSGRTEMISDVSKDSRFLRCFGSTKSEMTVPVLLGGKVLGVVDIESDLVNAHSSVDREFVEAVASKIAKNCV